MVSTIDMQDMRYLNLFTRMTHVSTRFCFKYNEIIIFCVPRSLVSKAIGPEGSNIKKMSVILRKKIKVIPCPNSISDAKNFISNIVSPVTFKDLEVKDGEVILTAGSQSKAALIGRNKRRLKEMQEIVKDYFGKEFKII